MNDQVKMDCPMQTRPDVEIPGIVDGLAEAAALQENLLQELDSRFNSVMARTPSVAAEEPKTGRNPESDLGQTIYTLSQKFRGNNRSIQRMLRECQL